MARDDQGRPLCNARGPYCGNPWGPSAVRYPRCDREPGHDGDHEGHVGPERGSLDITHLGHGRGRWVNARVRQHQSKMEVA